MKILLSGADGHVGKEIAEYFNKRKKYKLFLLSNKYKKKNNFFYQDLTRPINLNLKPDLVIHCAGKHKFSKKNNMQNIYSTNIKITRNIINFCNKNFVKRVIFLSSIDVYGKIRKKTVIENLKPFQSNLYGRSKFLSEKLLCNEKNKFKTACLRIPGIFTLDLSKNYPLIIKITKSIIKNKNLYIYNVNNKFNNILDVKEITKFVEIFLKKKIIKSKCYNFSASNPIKFIEVINLIKKIFKSKSKIINKDLKKKFFTISNNRISKDFNFSVTSTNKIISRCCRSILNKGTFYI